MGLHFSGMVALCAGCNQLKPWYAILIGFISGWAFIGWHHLMIKLKIDDPLDAVAGLLFFVFF